MPRGTPASGATPPNVHRHHCTSDHTFTEEETEFLIAMEEFKKLTGKKFPTWTDALGVLLRLGYARMMDVKIDSSWSWTDEDLGQTEDGIDWSRAIAI